MRFSSSNFALSTLVTTAALAAAAVALPAVAVEPTPPPVPASGPATRHPSVHELAVPATAPSTRPGRVVVAAIGRRATAAFRMVGMTWADGATPADIEVRVRAGGGWTAWQRLEVDQDGGGGGRPGTQPLWVDHADGVQARVLSSGPAPQGLRLALVDPDAPTSTMRLAAASTTPTLAAANVPAPDIVSRAEWGADESLTSTCDAGTYGHTVKVGFVHHTVNTNDYAATDSAALVRGIFDYHTQSRGYCDIGYNLLVDRFGTVFEGRRGGADLPVIGGHTEGHNTDSFGVAAIGNYEEAEPSAETLDALANVLAWKLALNYRDPLGRAVVSGDEFDVIAGHRDSKATSCPGQYLYADLPALRQRVMDLVGTYDSPIYRKWQALGGETGFVGSPFRGETTSGDATYAQFGGADLWWTSATGTHEVHGAIRDEYRRFSSRDGRLGVPTTDQKAGKRPGAVYNRFQGGRIYASATTGARTLYGPVLSRYLDLGADGSRLRLPTTGVKPGKRTGATFAAFQGGRIYRSSATGARPVWGPILARYRKLGYDGSRLRLPTRGEQAVTGGTVQRFQGGRIRWYRSSNTTKVFYG